MVLGAQVGEPVPAENAFDTDNDIIQVWENKIEKNLGFGFDTFVHFYFSIASGVSKIELVDSIFREADLPYSGWRYLKLTVSTWAIFFRVLWYLGYSKNAEPLSSVKHRAETASIKLKQLANIHGSVMLMGHGIFNLNFYVSLLYGV